MLYKNIQLFIAFVITTLALLMSEVNGEAIEKMSVQQLKAALKALSVDSSDCLEKSDLQSKLKWARENTNPDEVKQASNMPDFSVLPNLLFKRKSGGAAVKYEDTPILLGNTANPSALLVISHGFGDSPDTWRLPGLRVAHEMPHMLVYLAKAPRQPVTVAGGLPMSAWFDILQYPDLSDPMRHRREDVEGTLSSARYLSHMAGHVAHKYKIPTKRIIFGGFSQGAAVSIAAGLTSSYVPLGVLCMSGFFPAADAVIDVAKSTSHLETLIKEKTPFALFHGDSDSTLPIALARASLEKLVSLGLNATLKEYRGLAHTASDVEIKDVISWLSKIAA